MTIIETIKNILNFGFDNDNKLILKIGENKIIAEETTFEAKGKLYDNFDKKYLFDITEDNVDIFNLNFEKLISIPKKRIISVGIIDGSQLYNIRWENDDEDEFYTLYSKDKQLFTIPKFRGIFLNSKYRLEYNSYKTSEIKVFNLFNGGFLWKYVLPDGYTLSNKVQQIENTLFFTAYKEVNKYKKVIGLDLNTGKTLWEHNFKAPYNENVIASIINLQNNFCYGYFGKRYQVVNPITGEILLEKDMSSYYEKGISPTKNSIHENKLWFVSGKGEDIKFGAININNSEVQFIQNFPLENEEQLDTPIYHCGRLYLRGLHSKTLYIFEKEQNLA